MQPKFILPCLLKQETVETQCLNALDSMAPERRVYVSVPQSVWQRADPVFREALDNTIDANIVCTARIGSTCYLPYAAMMLGGLYKRNKFPSCIGKCLGPSGGWTIFEQGYVRCAGSNMREKAQAIIYMLQLRLSLLTNSRARIYNFRVQNIVSATKLPYEVNLQRLSDLNPLRFKYKPEQFPGIISKLSNCVMQVYSSGKMNIVGARHPDAAVSTLIEIEPTLRTCRLYKYDWRERGVNWDTLKERDTSPATRHPDVISCEADTRLSKKRQREVKEGDKQRRYRRKALIDLESVCTRKIKRIRGRAPLDDVDDTTLMTADPTADEDDDDSGAGSMTLLMEELELKRVRQERAETEKMDRIGLGDDKWFLRYILRVPHGTAEVEFSFTGTVQIIDASTQTEALVSLVIMDRVIKSCCG